MLRGKIYIPEDCKMATVPTPEEATSWLKIFGIVAGGFFTFVSGVVAATAVVLNKVNGFDKEIEGLKIARETEVKLCAIYRESVSKEIKALTEYHKSSINQLQTTVSSGNVAIVRLHERMDEYLAVTHSDENGTYSRKAKRLPGADIAIFEHHEFSEKEVFPESHQFAELEGES